MEQFHQWEEQLNEIISFTFLICKRLTTKTKINHMSKELLSKHATWRFECSLRVL